MIQNMNTKLLLILNNVFVVKYYFIINHAEQDVVILVAILENVYKNSKSALRIGNYRSLKF